MGIPIWPTEAAVEIFYWGGGTGIDGDGMGIGTGIGTGIDGMPWHALACLGMPWHALAWHGMPFCIHFVLFVLILYQIL